MLFGTKFLKFVPHRPNLVPLAQFRALWMLDSRQLWRNYRMRTKWEISKPWLSESIVTQPWVSHMPALVAGDTSDALKRHWCSQLLSLRTLVILMRFCDWVAASDLPHFANRNYQHQLTFRNCYVTFQHQFTPSKCCARRQISPLPLATPLSSRQIHKFASKYAHSQIYWSLPSTSIYKMLEGVGGCEGPKVI